MSCSEPNNVSHLHSPVTQDEGSPMGQGDCVALLEVVLSANTAVSTISGLLCPTRVNTVLHRLAKLISILFYAHLDVLHLYLWSARDYGLGRA